MTADLSGIRSQHEAALFKVESIHHIHGDQCLCGFKSSVSRDRTKHIMDVTLEAAAPSTVARLLGIVERVEAVLAASEEDRRIRWESKPTAFLADAVVSVEELRAAIAGQDE